MLPQCLCVLHKLHDEGLPIHPIEITNKQTINKIIRLLTSILIGQTNLIATHGLYKYNVHSDSTVQMNKMFSKNSWNVVAKYYLKSVWISLISYTTECQLNIKGCKSWSSILTFLIANFALSTKIGSCTLPIKEYCTLFVFWLDNKLFEPSKVKKQLTKNKKIIKLLLLREVIMWFRKLSSSTFSKLQ